MSRWVTNTSPLIFLAKLDRLELLRKAVDEVFVPSAVIEEIRQHSDEASKKIEEALRSWLQVKRVTDRQIIDILLADLDYGEAEAIALAREMDADRIVMDDLDARRLARRLNLTVVGTLGLLLGARLSGELASLKLEVDRLQREGFRVSAALVEAVLREAGEVE